MLLDIIEFDKLKRGAIHALAMLLVIGIQTQIISHVTVFGVRAMFVPAAVVAIGMLEGGVYGALMGLFAGLFTDGAFAENTTLFTMLFPIIGMLSGVLAESFVNKRYFSYLFMSVAALALTAFCQMFGLLVFRGANPIDLLITAGLQVLWSVPLAAVVYFPYRALAKGGGSRIKGQ